MTRLVLGSRNKKKLREMIDLLGDLSLELTDLTPYPARPMWRRQPTRSWGTRLSRPRNSRRRSNAWVIGEDSGLVVPALGGAPGVYSARYAGRHGDDAANNAKLLREMAALAGERARRTTSAPRCSPIRRARWSPRRRGAVTGSSWTAPRGTGGFGYDPLFLVPEYGKTFGELPSEVKQSMSHRARAFAQLASRHRARGPLMSLSRTQFRHRRVPPLPAIRARAVGQHGAGVRPRPRALRELVRAGPFRQLHRADAEGPRTVSLVPAR